MGNSDLVIKLDCPDYIRELGVQSSFDMCVEKLLKQFMEKNELRDPEEGLPIHEYDLASDVHTIYPNSEDEKAVGTFSNKLFDLVINATKPMPGISFHMDEPITDDDFTRFNINPPTIEGSLNRDIMMFRHYEDEMRRAHSAIEDIQGGTPEDATKFNEMLMNLARKSRRFAAVNMASGAAAVAFLNHVSSEVLAKTDMIRRSTDRAELRGYLKNNRIGGGSEMYEYTSGTVSPTVGRNWHRHVYNEEEHVQVIYHKDRIAEYMTPVTYDLLNPGGAGFDVRKNDKSTFANKMWGIYAREMEVRIADCPLKDDDGNNMIKEIRIYQEWGEDDESAEELARKCEPIADRVDVLTVGEDECNEEDELNERLSDY